MNVATVKLFCWLASAGLTAGLVGYAYDFFSNIKAKRMPLDHDHVGLILEESAEHSGGKVEHGISYDEIKRTFIHMNWTGDVAPAPPPVDEVELKDAPPIHTPVADLLTILMISVDTSDPSTSTIRVNYRGAGIKAQEGTLTEGDPLPSPHQGVKVSSIRIDGVEFEFDQEGRDTETLQPSSAGDENLIVQVGPDGVRYPVRRKFPTAIDTRPPSFEHTRLIGTNKYRIGRDDAKYFNDNYAAILTNDVRTKTYYEDGRRAGIEIQSIKAGSMAANHGIQSGDIIKSVNGHAVTSEHEAIKFFKTNQDKYSVWSVVVLSMGKEKTLIFESPE
ncbi:MAG: hypothetical protein E2O39_13695 [Planctomycetota bacterium]|nr:MAG: hypothetical protein E2O39_13695 [Planctomycetota bacterium]